LGRILRFKESVSVPLLFRLWHDNTKRPEDIARELGCSVPTLWRLKGIYGLPKRADRPVDEEYNGWRVDDPTEDQIEDRSAECRVKWSESVEQSRRSADSRHEVALVTSKDLFGSAAYS
jgi:hypothetical protein